MQRKQLAIKGQLRDLLSDADMEGVPVFFRPIFRLIYMATRRFLYIYCFMRAGVRITLACFQRWKHPHSHHATS